MDVSFTALNNRSVPKGKNLRTCAVYDDNSLTGTTQPQPAWKHEALAGKLRAHIILRNIR